MASAKTEKKLKTVVDMAERSASRMVGFILEERRGRGRREAAAVELKKKSAYNRADAAKVPKNAEAPTEARGQAETSSPLPASPARRQAETSSPLPASPEPTSLRRSAFSLSKRRPSFSLSTPQSPAAALHETPDDQLKRKNDLKEMPEVPTGLALNESGDCIGTEQSTVKEQFQQSPVVAPHSFHWHAKEVKVSHKMLMNLKNSDLELLASFERPPQVVELVMLAVHDLLGIQSLSWAGMKKMLHSDVPKPGDRHNERLPHEKFQAALAESASHRSWRPPGEKASEYPAPVKQQHVARIIKLVLEYTGQGRDPKEVQSMLKKYVSNPEFTVENAGNWSKAALALCVWVHAIYLHNKELTRKPRRVQIERAIENGSGYLRLPSNTRVWDLLPDIAAQTNQSMGTKSYDDLLASKNMLVRKVFRHPPPKLQADFREAPDVCERVGFVRDVDMRASYMHFKSNLQDRSSVSVKELRAKEQPALTTLCKFDHPAFASEAAGRRSWERFPGMDQGDVRFEDGAPRPLTVERNAKHAEELNRIYQTDMLTQKLLGAIEVNDQDAVRRLVFAGADLDWTDEKGRNVFDIAKELRQMACYKLLDTCRLRLHQARTEARVTLQHTKPVVLPRIALAVPPRTHHGKRRKPLKVVTYRKYVPVIEEKYKLQDANEYVTESEASSSSSEEEVDRDAKLRANTLRFMQEFVPPLTPPELSKGILPLQGDSVKTAIQRRPSAVEHPASSEFVRTQSSLGRVGSTGVEGAQDVDIEQVPSDGIMSTENEQASGSTFLTDMQGINEAGAEVETIGQDKNHVSSRTPRTTQSQKGRRERDKFIQREEGRTKNKRELFNILWSGVVMDGSDPRIIPIKGGIDAEDVTSQRHNYLRKCRELQIMPRPLVFGQPDPEHINLRRFGLRGKQCQALAEALEGLDTCKSLDLSENQLGGEGIRAICNVLEKNEVLTSLDLSSCQLRNSSEEVVDLLNLNRTISHLNLAGNELSDRALSKLLTAIRAAGRISCLNISRNFCGSSALQSLVGLVEQGRVLELDVSWTGLRLSFMESMENLRTNKYLTSLNLSYNGLCDESMNVLAQLFVETVGDSTSSMALKHVDLGHNRIQKKGAICLALALQKVAEVIQTKPDATFSLQNLVLNGNSIGEVGIRACLHAMGCGYVDFDVCKCLPDSACDNFFERGNIEKTYELDLSDFHDRLVADQLIKVANARFQGKRIIQSAIYEEQELRVADAGPDWTAWDWDPMYYDDEWTLMMLETVRGRRQKLRDFSIEALTNERKTPGLLQLVLDGPWSCFKCRFVGELEGAGFYFDIDLSGEDESNVLPIAPPDASKILGKKVYFEFSSGAESELSLVTCYARELEVKGVWEETYEHSEQETEESDKEHEAGGRDVKIHVFRVQVARCAAWEIENFPIRVGDASGTMHKCVETEHGIHLHVKNLTIEGSLAAPDFQYKHQQVELKYNVFGISSLFDEDQVAALSEAGATCKCWYVDKEPLLPMEDAAFGKLLPVFEKMLVTGGEDRLLQIVLGVAKDASLTPEQAILVARIFSRQRSQKLVYQQFCGEGNPMNIPKAKMVKQVKIKKYTIDDDVFVRNIVVADSLLQERRIDRFGGEAHEAGAGTFFDLFRGALALTRLDDEISDSLNVGTQTSMLGVAFAFFDADTALPRYDFESLRFSFTKETDDTIINVDFKVIAIKEEQRTILLQDQAIGANDGGSGAYSLMKLTEQGETYTFEFPSRNHAADQDVSRVATSKLGTPPEKVDAWGIAGGAGDPSPSKAEGVGEDLASAEHEAGGGSGKENADAGGGTWNNVELSVCMSIESSTLFHGP